MGKEVEVERSAETDRTAQTKAITSKEIEDDFKQSQLQNEKGAKILNDYEKRAIYLVHAFAEEGQPVHKRTEHPVNWETVIHFAGGSVDQVELCRQGWLMEEEEVITATLKAKHEMIDDEKKKHEADMSKKLHYEGGPKYIDSLLIAILWYESNVRQAGKVHITIDMKVREGLKDIGLISKGDEVILLPGLRTKLKESGSEPTSKSFKPWEWVQYEVPGWVKTFLSIEYYTDNTATNALLVLDEWFDAEGREVFRNLSEVRYMYQLERPQSWLQAYVQERYDEDYSRSKCRNWTLEKTYEAINRIIPTLEQKTELWALAKLYVSIDARLLSAFGGVKFAESCIDKLCLPKSDRRQEAIFDSSFKEIIVESIKRKHPNVEGLWEDALIERINNAVRGDKERFRALHHILDEDSGFQTIKHTIEDEQIKKGWEYFDKLNKNVNIFELLLEAGIVAEISDKKIGFSGDRKTILNVMKSDTFTGLRMEADSFEKQVWDQLDDTIVEAIPRFLNGTANKKEMDTVIEALASKCLIKPPFSSYETGWKIARSYRESHKIKESIEREKNRSGTPEDPLLAFAKRLGSVQNEGRGPPYSLNTYELEASIDVFVVENASNYISTSIPENCLIVTMESDPSSIESRYDILRSKKATVVFYDQENTKGQIISAHPSQEQIESWLKRTIKNSSFDIESLQTDEGETLEKIEDEPEEWELIEEYFLGIKPGVIDDTEVEWVYPYIRNGRLSPFSMLFYGLPGCGKSARIRSKVAMLINGTKALESKGNTLDISDDDVVEISIINEMGKYDGEIKPSSIQRTLYTLLEESIKKPKILVLKDLDAFTENSGIGTGEIRFTSKTYQVLKQALGEIFSSTRHQIAVFGEAENIADVPEPLLQFFPRREVLIPPSKSERHAFFEKASTEIIRAKFDRRCPEAMETFISLYGHNLDDDQIKNIAERTTGFTYRDLHVIARDLAGQKSNQFDLTSWIKDYKPSLPSVFCIEVPETEFNDIKGYKGSDRDIIGKIKKVLNISDDSICHPKHTETPRGILFWGKPGTGKTMVGKAIAKSTDAYFIRMAPSDIYSKYVGESEKNIKNIFSIARDLTTAKTLDKKPRNVILFIDELDGLAPSRKETESRAERSVLSVLLSELDGLERTEGLTVIGTTNHKENIDEALLRPGRFDLKFEFKYPDPDGQAEVFQFYFEKRFLNLREDVLPYECIVAKALGKEKGEEDGNLQEDEWKKGDFLSPADIELVVRRASWFAGDNTDVSSVRMTLEEQMRDLVEEKKREICEQRSRNINTIDNEGWSSIFSSGKSA